MLASDQTTSSSPGQAWIQAATTASVIILAVIAAAVSYGHMHVLALRHGEGTWASALIPLSVDGMIVAASMSLLLDSRLGSRGGFLPWTLLIIGAMASLGADPFQTSPTRAALLSLAIATRPPCRPTTGREYPGVPTSCGLPEQAPVIGSLSSREWHGPDLACLHEAWCWSKCLKRGGHGGPWPLPERVSPW